MIKNLKCKNGDILQMKQISIPIGILEIESCSKGLHKLKFKEVYRESDNQSTKHKVNEKEGFKSVEIINKKDDSEINYKPILTLLIYLDQYFTDSFNDSILNQIPSICWSSICNQNSFTEKVLKKLLNTVHPGMTISYKDLALVCDNPNAQRAVGTVMKNNPIVLIIPCHRVINSNAKIGNYNGGAEIKEWLLNYEKQKFNN